jgi:hypothetical protein
MLDQAVPAALVLPGIQALVMVMVMVMGLPWIRRHWLFCY